ncbi:chorismate-binding protein, partial [Oceanospirillum sp. HFRX-1_2]
MTPERFSELAAAGYNRIPLVREVLADLDTPLSTYLKLADQPYSYLLESVEGGEKWGRYSIIGLPCQRRLQVRGHEVTLFDGNAVIEQSQQDDPLSYIEDFQKRFSVPELDNLPLFTGGLVGYFGYDTVRYVEKRLVNIPENDPIDVPDILLLISEEVVVFDNLSGKLYLIVHANTEHKRPLEKARQRLNELERQLRSLAVSSYSVGTGRTTQESDFKSGFTEEKFKEAVSKIKEYVLAGDIMQCVISQRMSTPFEAQPLELYRALRCLNPSPYMFFFNLDDFHVVGSSPEILARVEDNLVTVRPIAGTRKRGATEAEDKALEEELLADPKELAEHLMLIDLGRNDVGRIAQTGSVTLTDKMVIERYSHVMHIVSSVTGQLKEGMSAIDVLKATLPAGTLSGAPKVRAMEIIDEMEPVKR